MLRPIPSVSPRRLASAFTLIELLTVIAIVGVLAAILIPVVGKVRASAKQSACTSNLRQAMLASTLYAQDHRQLLPMHFGAQLTPARPTDYSGGISWFTAVARHIQTNSSGESANINTMSGREHIFMCPGGADTVQRDANNPYVGNYAARFSYYDPPVERKMKINWQGTEKDAVFAQLQRIANPNRTIGLLDYPENGIWNSGSDSASQDAMRQRFGEVKNRHGERINVAFVAGNVRSFAIEELIATRASAHPDRNAYWFGR